MLVASQDSVLGQVVVKVIGMCDSSSSSFIQETVQWLILSPISSWALVVMLTIALVHFLSGYFRSFKVKTVVYDRDSTLSRHITENVTNTSGYYVSPVWASSPYLQTFLAPFLLKSTPGQFRRDYLQLNDLGVIAMDWYYQQQTRTYKKCTNTSDLKVTRSITIKKSKYIMIIVPDANRDCFSVVHAAYEAYKRELSVVVFNRRGQGGSVLTTPKLQSYGDASDLRQMVKYVRGRYPKQELVAIGFGAGADLLMSYLGEYGSSSYLKASVAISPLYDPQTSFSQSSISIFKPLHFLKLFKEKFLILRHSASLQKSLDIYDVLKSSSFAQLNKKCYYKFSNCSDENEFWDKNSPLRDVDDISSPLLCISSLDDPMYESSTIPFNLFNLYLNMCLVTTEHGGHNSFVQLDSSGRWTSWAVILALKYIQSVAGFSSD